MSTIDHEYCFADLDGSSVFLDKAKHCNPYAKAKVDEQGRCICTPPYTGPTCDSCERGYVAQSKRSWASSDHEEFTVCVPDIHSDAVQCNGHGHQRGHTCDCDHGFAGDHCEYCEDPRFEYPDCTGRALADAMDSAHFAQMEKQRHEQVY